MNCNDPALIAKLKAYDLFLSSKPTISAIRKQIVATVARLTSSLLRRLKVRSSLSIAYKLRMELSSNKIRSNKFKATEDFISMINAIDTRIAMESTLVKFQEILVNNKY